MLIPYEKILLLNPESKKIFLTQTNNINIFDQFSGIIYKTYEFLDKNLHILNGDYDLKKIKIYDQNEIYTDYKALFKKYNWEIFLIRELNTKIRVHPKPDFINSNTENKLLINFIPVIASNNDVKAYFDVLNYRKDVLN